MKSVHKKIIEENHIPYILAVYYLISIRAGILTGIFFHSQPYRAEILTGILITAVITIGPCSVIPNPPRVLLYLALVVGIPLAMTVFGMLAGAIFTH